MCLLIIVHIQGRSQKWIYCFPIPYGEILKGKTSRPIGASFYRIFPLRVVPILKRGAIEKSHCRFSIKSLSIYH